MFSNIPTTNNASLRRNDGTSEEETQPLFLLQPSPSPSSSSSSLPGRSLSYGSRHNYYHDNDDSDGVLVRLKSLMPLRGGRRRCVLLSVLLCLSLMVLALIMYGRAHLQPLRAPASPLLHQQQPSSSNPQHHTHDDAGTTTQS